MDQHIGGKWLILHTNRHKDNQLQSLEDEYRFIRFVTYQNWFAENISSFSPFIENTTVPR